MTRSCYLPVRGYCFCEFCIAAHFKNAYVQANNSPKEPINFKNFKKSINLSPLEIYCKQFSNLSSDEELSNLQRAYNTPLNSPNQPKFNIEIGDNQTKFLRILSDRLTQLAEQQAHYIINSAKSSSALNNISNLNNSTLDLNQTIKLNSTINSKLLQRRSKMFDNTRSLAMSSTRLRSSVSESNSYELVKNTQPKNTTHCNSAGMLFNTTRLSINKEEQRIRIKFGPEDILSTTNPILLFESNLVDESTSLNRKTSRRRRKSNNKKEMPVTANKPTSLLKNVLKDTESTDDTKKSSNKLSDVTNTIQAKVTSKKSI